MILPADSLPGRVGKIRRMTMNHSVFEQATKSELGSSWAWTDRTIQVEGRKRFIRKMIMEPIIIVIEKGTDPITTLSNQLFAFHGIRF